MAAESKRDRFLKMIADKQDSKGKDDKDKKDDSKGDKEESPKEDDKNKKKSRLDKLYKGKK